MLKRILTNRLRDHHILISDQLWSVGHPKSICNLHDNTFQNQSDLFMIIRFIFIFTVVTCNFTLILTDQYFHNHFATNFAKTKRDSSKKKKNRKTSRSFIKFMIKSLFETDNFLYIVCCKEDCLQLRFYL